MIFWDEKGGRETAADYKTWRTANRIAPLTLGLGDMDRIFYHDACNFIYP
jgi:hypothetical protein